jgi:hypothetical protein
LYGDAGVMTLSSGPGGGLHVALTLPFRDAP